MELTSKAITDHVLMLILTTTIVIQDHLTQMDMDIMIPTITHHMITHLIGILLRGTTGIIAMDGIGNSQNTIEETILERSLL